MKNRNSKKGSSLLTVLMIFFILSISGTAVLALTFATLKNSISEANSKKNLYFSESGINIAYGVVGKVVDEAVTAGNAAVADYMQNSLNGPNGILQREMNHIKNQEICEYPLATNPLRSTFIINDEPLNGTNNFDNMKINDATVKTVQNSVFKNAYMDYMLTKNIVGSENYRVVNAITQRDYTLEGVSEKPEISISGATVDRNSKVFLILPIQSKFLKGDSDKTVSAEIKISVPDYNAGYYVTSNKVTYKSNPTLTKALLVNKDMFAGGDLTIAGDIYVKGKDYGIDVNEDDSHVTFLNKVVTAGNITLSNPRITFNAAADVYTSSFVSEDTSIGTTVNIGTLYSNNDFAMNGNQTNVAITNFYGINDNRSSLDETAKMKNSSSILINSDDIGDVNGSTFAITGKSYIMGTGYVDTYDDDGNLQKQYQTGESVAVKGNYKAYNYEFAANVYNRTHLGNFKSDNVIFEYSNPLQLAQKYYKLDAEYGNPTSELINMENNCFEKVDYFLAYDNAINGDATADQLRKAGITLPLPANRLNIGALITGNAVASDNYYLDPDGEGKIREKKIEFVKQVCYMGDSYGISDAELYTGYNNGDFIIAKGFDTQIKTGAIVKTQKSSDIREGKEVIFIDINKDAPTDYTLLGSNGTSKTGTNTITATGKSRGVIVVNGDLYVSGDIDFTGTIVVGGSLHIVSETGHPKKFSYDENYVKKLIGYDYSVFSNVINNDSNDALKQYTVETGLSVNSDPNIKNSIRENLVSVAKWRIVK